MSGVYRNMNPPPPHRPASACVPPAFGAGGGHTRWVERGWGVNSSEDARHCSVLYICKYFVTRIIRKIQQIISNYKQQTVGALKICKNIDDKN
jgi:hypothetical protein